VDAVDALTRARRVSIGAGVARFVVVGFKSSSSSSSTSPTTRRRFDVDAARVER